VVIALARELQAAFGRFLNLQPLAQLEDKMRILPLVVSITIVSALTITGERAARAQCPYSSVQIRVQPNTSIPWTTSASLTVGASVHVGVFKNGWGVPVDAGGVVVYLVQGSYYEVIPLAGWQTTLSARQGTYSLLVYCGALSDSATVSWPSSSTVIDVLSYVLPNTPNGVVFSNITNLGIPWHTFSSSYFTDHERLPGFFITKGNLDASLVAWNFEEMIYDSNWIYLVRDTSWTATCTDDSSPAGMLVFHWNGSQYLRGGRHFPRFINNGGTIDTGVTKYVQGVEIKKSPTDNAQDGRWCPTAYSGLTSSSIRADLLGARTVGNTTFADVLQLRVVGGSGTPDTWWYAHGYGFIRFTDGNITEQFSFKKDPYNVQVHIPCDPTYCM
jgi:hypothetical protein